LDQVAGDSVTDLRFEREALGAFEAVFGSDAPPFGFELGAQFVDVEAHIVDGLVFGECVAAAIDDFPTDRWNADGAVGLRALVFAELAIGDDLNPPETSHENSQAADDA